MANNTRKYMATSRICYEESITILLFANSTLEVAKEAQI